MTARFAALALACVLAGAACKRTANGDDDEQKPTPSQPAPAESGDSKTPPAPAPAPTEFQHVVGDGYEGWISPRTTATPYIPTPEHVAALEAHTARALAEAKEAGAIPPEVDITDYVRKYEGYHHQGKRHIEVEYICPQNKSLASKHVAIAGGYTCFVKALYTVEDDTLGSWRVNPKK